MPPESECDFKSSCLVRARRTRRLDTQYTCSRRATSTPRAAERRLCAVEGFARGDARGRSTCWCPCAALAYSFTCPAHKSTGNVFGGQLASVRQFQLGADRTACSRAFSPRRLAGRVRCVTKLCRRLRTSLCPSREGQCISAQKKGRLLFRAAVEPLAMTRAPTLAVLA